LENTALCVLFECAQNYYKNVCARYLVALHMLWTVLSTFLECRTSPYPRSACCYDNYMFFLLGPHNFALVWAFFQIAWVFPLLWPQSPTILINSSMELRKEFQNTTQCSHLRETRSTPCCTSIDLPCVDMTRISKHVFHYPCTGCSPESQPRGLEGEHVTLTSIQMSFSM
jgi:hypothetical protein